MQYVPSTAELVEAVAEWLEGPASSALTGAEKYNARIASNVLRSVERELRAGSEHHAKDRQALHRYLLPGPEPTSDEALVRAVADRVRAGELDDERAPLLSDLHQYTVRKLLLTNPRYLRGDDRSLAQETA